MYYYTLIFLLIQISNFYFCQGDADLEENVNNDKLLNGFIKFYNNLPNQIYTCEKGTLDYAEKVDETSYKIQVVLKVTDVKNPDIKNTLKCICTVQDSLDTGVTVLNNEYQCQVQGNENNDGEEVITEEVKPVQLDNEVQSNIAVTSGEQFIAIPREEPAVPCVGCASHVNPQAAGVVELASLGIKHLDRHESNVKHTLKSVVDVERQVQVVNGVRYILTLLVDYNNCTDTIDALCQSTKPCKISILEKPWVRLPNGEKYRAILANNCTDSWQFGDNGEVINENSDNNKETNEIDVTSNNNNAGDDNIKVVHTEEVESLQNKEKPITDDQIKNIEEQILPHKELVQGHAIAKNHVFDNKGHGMKEEAKFNEDSLDVKNKKKRIPLSEDRKKAVDDLIFFFNLYGFGSDQLYDTIPRVKRSFDEDLEVVSLAEKYEALQNALRTGKHLYNLAQTIVDYLNEIDLEVKTRVLNEVLKAEEETENYQHFVYIQARVIIPCEKVDCSSKDTIRKICNGIIDDTDNINPRVLNAFCYSDQEETELNKVKSVPLDDPILIELAKEGRKKIETESTKENAITIKKIIGANTQRAAGSLTKFTIIFNYLNCTKHTPLTFRRNCTILEELGSSICEIIIHERNKQRKFTYSCIERPIEGSFFSSGERKAINIYDPKVIQMVQEALQYLELQSNRNNKQKVLSINSVSTQLNAGLLTDIEFIVGYTQCTNDIEVDLDTCEVLANEPVRKCKAQIWDRTWIEDGRKIEVTCEDNSNLNDNIQGLNNRKKRSINFVGGREPVDVNDAQYKTLAEESLLKFIHSSGNQQHYNIVKIIEASVQVVSGIITRLEFTISPTDCVLTSEGQVSSKTCNIVDTSDIITCKSTIFEQLWLNNKQIHVTCGTKDRKRREVFVGGLKQMDPTGLKYKQLAEQSFQKYLVTSGYSQPNSVIHVENVTEQIVAGKITRLNFIVFSDHERHGNIIKCHSEVWEKPWVMRKEINVNCNIKNEEHRKKRQLPGGLKEQDPNDPRYTKLADESLQKYLETSGNTKPHRVVRVDKVSTQVVSGTKTLIDFTVTPTTDTSGDIIKCHSEVWEQPWLKKKEIDVNCHIDNQVHRTKRHLPGGLKEQDPNDPRYTKLADESLQKYLETSGNTKPHRVVRVDKVSTQVVSGTKTLIDFTVTPTTDTSGDIIKCYSEVWEQPWLKKKEIDVNCHIDNQVHRTKRHLTGGLKEQDANDPRYTKLADESLQKYLKTSGNTKPHRVVRVDKVRTQVVSGTKTLIDFAVTPTTDTSGDIIKCHSEVWEQPWLKKKEIDVNCHIDNQVHRTKRHLPGGLKEQDPNDPRYTKLADESLQKYLKTSGNTKPHRVVRVDKVRTQVVSGTKTLIDFAVTPTTDTSGDIIKCHSEVWEQPWLKKKEIDVNCHIDNQVHRTKRHLPGGLKEQDPNDPRYIKLADESIQKYLKTSGNTKPHRVVRVDKVRTQVVSGTKTLIDFAVTPTTDTSGDIIKCHSEVWEQPWLKKKEIDVSCHIDNQVHRTKRHLPGGLKEQDPNDPRYTKLADESLQKYLETSGNTKPHRVVRVDKVRTQVVSGTKTLIDFAVTPTTDTSGDIIKCHSEVWEQPWLKKKEIDVNCHIDNQVHRTKRHLTGGLKEQDPNDPRYTKLADESLQKYLETSGNTKPHRVVRVDKVRTQVVSGTKTLIDFAVTPTTDTSGDIIKCHSEVWEQPWLKKKEIDVNCHIDNQMHRTKRHLPGGLKEQDPNDPRYTKLADESLQKYLENSGNTKPHRVVRVDKVSTQVVSGTKTLIDFAVTPTTDTSGDIIKCHSEVWEQPWLKKKEIDVNCHIDNQVHRTKRHLTGRLMEQDPNNLTNRDKHTLGNKRGNTRAQDPTKREFRVLAQESLLELRRLEKNKFIHKVVEVKRVVTKVVSGLIYDIDFTALPTTCKVVLHDLSRCKPRAKSNLLYCNTYIWSQPWRNKKTIDVSCNTPKNSTVVRKRRQSIDDEDYIDEDLRYYYAERAMQQLNQESQTNNLYKLVTIHTTQNSVHMGATMIRMFIEIAPTFCLRHADENDLQNCEEMDGLNHKLCLARLWPSPDDELAIQSVNIVCDDDSNFISVTGLSITQLLKASLNELENTHEQKYKLVHLGEPHLVPNLDLNIPTTLSFIVGFTNCTKDMDLDRNRYHCYMDENKGTKPCTSFIWFVPNSREIYQINVKCKDPGNRRKRSVPLTAENATADDLEIQKLVQQSLEKLEMASIHRYKQRVLLINSYSTKITTGKVTTIDFDVGYTSCLKYEWVDDVTACEFLENLPRRHCVSQIYERLWLQNGRNIEVHCVDDETPLEAHIEFESAEMAMELAKESLKHIEAKYPHPRKQKVVRIFSLDKQVIAGIHYRMKIEVGFTNCTALSAQTYCKLIRDEGINRFCRVNVWLRPWTDHPPNYRVTCDYQETATADVYHHIQAEHLFYDFITTYGAEYLNDHNEMRRRFDIFKDNVKRIHEMNVHERGTATYGVTRFADLTYEEFSTKYMGLKPSLRNHNEMPMRKAEIPKTDAPEKFDWRDFNTVTEVKDQGSCGSCWAFSVTGNIEGQWKLHTGSLVSLSEQELVDCDKLDQGCNGGLPDNAYRAIEQLGGLELENDYPYEGADDKCVFNKSLSKVQISGAVNISSNETDMAKWLVHNGPISIGINANAMQFYMGGISHPWRMLCSPSNLDHGVLIVGYGIKDYPLFHKRLPYWTIKNSWGKSWGEQGYYRVYRGDGTCGVNQMASSALI